MTTEVSLPPSLSVDPALQSVSWRLLAALAVLLLVCWQLPPLDFLPSGFQFFPLWVHTLTEQFAIVVAMLIFAVSWHTFTVDRAANVLIIACGFLAAGLLDFGHLLSYRGMPDLVTPASPGKAISFWLAARYVVAGTMLAVALRPWQPLRHEATRYLLLAASLVVVVAVFAIELYLPETLPVLFIDGVGLTGIKVALEGGVVALTLMTAWRIHLQERDRLKSGLSGLLITACGITVLSELCLMLYANVNDLFSLLGHLYKILAYFFIYRAVFVNSVHEPYRRLKIEVIERELAENKAAHLAYHDPLTALPNRLLLRDRVEHAINHARRSSHSLVLIFIDLDNFKAVNDTLGHSVGDALLKAVADKLSRCLRVNDTMSRQGGDEFIVLLPDLDHADEALPVLFRLLQESAATFEVGPHQIVTSSSMGVAVYPQDGEDFDTLLKHADMAMYRAKASGRNTYRFFDEAMHTEAIEQQDVRNGLRRALENHELVLHYQPQVCLQSGAIVGAEALLRWERPGQGLVPPASFIPVAEDSGLIVPIGAWVMQEACRQAMAWQREGKAPLRMAVNLSSVQFARPGLVETVREALASSGLPPAQLELELTESILISDTETVLQTVRELKSLGVCLSIDDFGTGYSSLQYLRRFAVDRLKIDKSFVLDMEQDPDAIAIVRAVIEMARSLGLRTIAEGVESEAGALLLRGLGCDEGQGYHFARPQAADALTPLLPA